MVNEIALSSVYKKLGFSYLGKVAQSVKMRMSYEHNVATYCLYLAPSTMSGHQVCPNDTYCKQFCLNASGQNRVDILARGVEHSIINKSRIKKTKLFFENRDLFMQIMIAEIIKAQQEAKRKGMEFAVRINGTSDLSPLLFKYQGYNILELFPNVQFYDYTKVYNRTKLSEIYPNYDLTLSFNGHNWDECEDFLRNNGKVAVVFEGQLPKKYMGFDVIDANTYDMRYLDPKRSIMGLHYHPVASDYVNGHYVSPNTPFVVREDSIYSEF